MVNSLERNLAMTTNKELSLYRTAGETAYNNQKKQKELETSVLYWKNRCLDAEETKKKDFVNYKQKALETRDLTKKLQEMEEYAANLKTTLSKLFLENKEMTLRLKQLEKH